LIIPVVKKLLDRERLETTTFDEIDTSTITNVGNDLDFGDKSKNIVIFIVGGVTHEEVLILDL
jgi:hypothetical protein